MANVIAIGGGGGKGEEYFSGTLTTIDNQNKINVNMTRSTPADIAQQSAANPNVLFFTEGSPSTGSGISMTIVTLSANSWDNSNEQTVTVSGVTSTSGILASPVPTYIEQYADCGIYAIGQTSNTVTFKCIDVPEVDLSVNVAFWEGAGQ